VAFTRDNTDISGGFHGLTQRRLAFTHSACAHWVAGFGGWDMSFMTAKDGIWRSISLTSFKFGGNEYDTMAAQSSNEHD
jgi:hypothetical protein